MDNVLAVDTGRLLRAEEAAVTRPRRGPVRRTLRIAIPVIMLGFGVVSVTLGGWQALVAIIPILAIHVLVALVVIPIWVRYRRRRPTGRHDQA